jgi:hypothetical protein
MYAQSLNRIKNINLPEISDSIAGDVDALRIREAYLDSKIMNSPNAVAQEISSKIFHQLADCAPYMLPQVIND